MPERLLQLEDVRNAQNPEQIAVLFRKLGYNASAEPLSVEELELPSGSAEAVIDAYVIAREEKDDLWVCLFRLQPKEFSSESDAKSRMTAIAKSVCQRRGDFLLLGTKDYKQLLLVNPQQNFDDDLNLKLSFKFWQIELTNPSFSDLNFLEAIAAFSTVKASDLFRVHCETFDVRKQDKNEINKSENPDSVRIYLQEIGKFKLLNKGEELELEREIIRLQELEAVREELANELGGQPQDDEWAKKVGMELEDFKSFLQALRKAKEKMIVSNLRLVVSIAKKYQGMGVEFLDLIQEGNLGLIKAVERFEPNKGYKFSTYATWWIRQAVTRAIHKYSRIIKLPINIWEKISKIKKASKYLCQKNGRQPTQAEIANHLEITVIELQDILKCEQKTFSLNIETGQDEDSTLIMLIPSREETPQEKIEKQDTERVLKDILSTPELDVIVMRYGCAKTLREVGNNFNLSRERIRQIEEKALDKLQANRIHLDSRTFFSTIVDLSIKLKLKTTNLSQLNNSPITQPSPTYIAVEKPTDSLGNTIVEAEGFSTSNALLTAIKLKNSEATSQKLYQEKTQKVVAFATSIDQTYNVGDLKPMNHNSAELKEQLQTLKDYFVKVQNNFFEAAESLGISSGQPGDEMVDFSPLESLLSSIEKAEEERSRATEIRQQALTVLERVLAIIHRDNTDFQPLLECQEKARELHKQVSSLEVDAQSFLEDIRPFSELLNLIEGVDKLDENRLTELQDTIAESFERTLATAALREKLIVQPIFSSSLKNVAVTVPSPVEDCQQQFVVEPPVLEEQLVEVPTLLSTTEIPKDSNNQDLVASTENKKEEVQLVGRNGRNRVRGEIP